MPGDPKEARAHAANCMQLAETASGPTLQKTFADLAKQWNRLANELDDAHALQKALNELDLKEATTSDGDLSPLRRRRPVNNRHAFALSASECREAVQTLQHPFPRPLKVRGRWQDT